MRIAAGTVSFDDCEALTWSFGCTGWPSTSEARLASTSLTFMFVDVPDPVWNTSTGNWSSSSPVSTRRAAAAMAPAVASSTPGTPSPAFTRAAWRLMAARAWATRTSSGRPAIGKLAMASSVCVPQRGSVIASHPTDVGVCGQCAPERRTLRGEWPPPILSPASRGTTSRLSCSISTGCSRRPLTSTSTLGRGCSTSSSCRAVCRRSPRPTTSPTSTGDRASTACARSSPPGGSSCRRARSSIRPATAPSPPSATARTSCSRRCSGTRASPPTRVPSGCSTSSPPAARSWRSSPRRGTRGRCSTPPGSTPRFPVVADGVVAAERGIAGKPAPDLFLDAARSLGVDPAQAVVVEDAVSGVAAGRTGDFGLVIGVDRGAGHDALRASGADVVVDDLGELVGGGP